MLKSYKGSRMLPLPFEFPFSGIGYGEIIFFNSKQFFECVANGSVTLKTLNY